MATGAMDSFIPSLQHEKHVQTELAQNDFQVLYFCFFLFILCFTWTGNKRGFDISIYLVNDD
jgi:hypothetical protein